jgi:hypothetical protein
MMAPPLSLKSALSAITVQHIADSLMDVEVKDAHGSVPLETSDDPLVTGNDSAFRHWRATRPTSSRISVSYSISIRPAPEHGPPLGMAAAGQGVAGCGIGFLLLPENTASNETRMIWDLSSMPAGSVGVVTSGRGDANVIGPPSEMFKQWVLAGPALSVNFDRPSGFHGYLVGAPPFDGKDMLEFGDRSYSALGAWFSYLGVPNTTFSSEPSTFRPSEPVLRVRVVVEVSSMLVQPTGQGKMAHTSVAPSSTK